MCTISYHISISILLIISSLNPGEWHYGISQSVCESAGGQYFRNPCITLKECIDNRFTVGDPGYSTEFENYVRGTRDSILIKKIRISQLGIGVSLSLSEVQAFDASGLNIALNKQSSQSSIEGEFSADKGNNGVISDFSQTDTLGNGK